MREILFRGQTRRHGEKVRMNGEKVPGRWVYGGVLQCSGDHSIIYGGENADDPGEGLDKWPVYTDTLGQYIGLKDKNGKKIFEGDILCIEFEGDSQEGFMPYKWCENAKVVFSENYHQWAIVFENENDEEISMWEYDDTDAVAVIGNIYDNSELLKECAHE